MHRLIIPETKQRYPAGALIKAEFLIEGGVGAVTAVLPFTQITIHPYRRGSRGFEIIFLCVNQARGVGDIAAKTNSEFLRRASERTIRAAHHLSNAEIGRLVRHLYHLRVDITGGLETFVNVPERASSAEFGKVKPARAEPL